ncbi:MAG: transcriptional regulator PadR family protein [Bryobacterales bacterium]|nr:transcriptional regulator PadR family protein [Bryobacterales bacterium]
MLGEFEYLVISAAMQRGEKAYGAAIRDEIEQTTKRPCSIGALYTTLDRLESKALIATWMGEATSERGGRAKRMVRVTAKGIRAASEFYNTVKFASRGLVWEAD